jgi:hypothetical protein
MKIHFFLGLILSAATGCSSSSYVGKEPARDTCSFAQLNENCKGHIVAIWTLQGEEIMANDLFVDPDSTTFQESTTEKRTAIVTSSVERVTIRRVGAGAIDGIIWGAIVGAPIGVFLGAAAAALEDSGDKLDGAVVAGSIAVASALGAGVGALARHTDEYVFPSGKSSHRKGK